MLNTKSRPKPNGPLGGKPHLGPDMISIPQMHKLLGIDDAFYGEFGILAPHLRKITGHWAADIPRNIVVDEATQELMTIRDLNRLTEYVAAFVDEMTAGKFGENFESALDGIAVIMRKHGINPGWATSAFTTAFDRAQQHIYSETRSVNNRVFPAALRCLTKVMALTFHILNRRDHELNDSNRQRGSKG